MSSVLTQNYFELFSLPQRYALDRGALDARYRDLQRSAHPDRHAGAGDQQRRLSLQQAARINEAYEVLKDPLRRGRYLLELRGQPGGSETATHQDAAFLMQQMELREALAEVRGREDPLGALDTLTRDIENRYRALEAELAAALDGPSAESAEALALVEKMQFFARLRQEAQELEAELEDELL
jgi:molecular chaperone HscB